MLRSSSLKSIAGSVVMLALPMFSGCNNVNSHALNTEGVRLYQNGNYQQAAVQFQRAIATNPNSGSAYYNLASTLHKSGKMHNRQQDLTQAEQLYNQCLDYDPNHTECHRALAVLLMETDRQDAAFRLLEGWASRNPQSAEPQIELARLLEESNRLSDASSRLETALTIDPYSSRALTALGRIRELSGDTSQALANYQRSLAINRFQPTVEARVASLQGHQGLTAPIVTPPNQTRTVQQSPSAVRY